MPYDLVIKNGTVTRGFLGVELLDDVGAVATATHAAQHVDEQEHDGDGDDRHRDEADDAGGHRLGIHRHRRGRRGGRRECEPRQHVHVSSIRAQSA